MPVVWASLLWGTQPNYHHEYLLTSSRIAKITKIMEMCSHITMGLPIETTSVPSAKTQSRVQPIRVAKTSFWTSTHQIDSIKLGRHPMYVFLYDMNH